MSFDKSDTKKKSKTRMWDVEWIREYYSDKVELENNFYSSEKEKKFFFIIIVNFPLYKMLC